MRKVGGRADESSINATSTSGAGGISGEAEGALIDEAFVLGLAGGGRRFEADGFALELGLCASLDERSGGEQDSTAAVMAIVQRETRCAALMDVTSA